MLLSHSLLASAGRTALGQASLLTRTLLVFLMASSALRAQTPNPVLDLKFDEGKGTTAADSSGNNNNATLLGNAAGPLALSARPL